MSDKRPRIKYVKPEEKDPFELKRKSKKPGIVVKSRAIKFRERK